jgi:HlyD family secretion protein
MTQESYTTHQTSSSAEGINLNLATEGSPRARGFSMRTVVLAAIGCVLLGLAYWFSNRQSAGTTSAETSNHGAALAVPSIPVNTVRPQKKTLVRTLEIPGSIRPWAQAELYARASGYLKTIARRAPQTINDLGPQIDIGAVVRKGELLLEISTPERDQGIVEKQTLIRQREAELEVAQSALVTFEAQIEASKAQIAHAQADIRKLESEHTLRKTEHQRLVGLVQSRTVPPEIADEKAHQVNASLSAVEAGRAKIQSAHAEMSVVSSKLATAKADIKVKQGLVQIAHDDLKMAETLADFSRIRAPFDGMITYRDVDEGDFVQNATSGQSRRLMTVTSLDRVIVVLQVPDRDAPWVRIGAEASLVVASAPPRKGRVSRIAHVLDAQTRTMQVEVDLDNKDRALLPGMYGKVNLTLQEIPNAQAIPATAVYSRKGENFILEVQGGLAHRVPVRIRYDDGKVVEVVKVVDRQEVPLTGSEELIVSNKGEIADGQRVQPSLLTSFLVAPAARAESGGALAHVAKPLNNAKARDRRFAGGSTGAALPDGLPAQSRPTAPDSHLSSSSAVNLSRLIAS